MLKNWWLRSSFQIQHKQKLFICHIETTAIENEWKKNDWAIQVWCASILISCKKTVWLLLALIFLLVFWFLQFDVMNIRKNTLFHFLIQRNSIEWIHSHEFFLGILCKVHSHFIFKFLYAFQTLEMSLVLFDSFIASFQHEWTLEEFSSLFQSR